MRTFPSNQQPFKVLKTVRLQPYTGLVEITRTKLDRLPELFIRKNGITLPLPGDLPTAAVAQRIMEATNIPVRFKGRAQKEEPFTVYNLNIPPIGGTSGDVWQGALVDLLDQWTDFYGYNWGYNEESGSIDIIRMAGSTFAIYALGGSQKYDVLSSTSGSNSDDGSNVNLSSQSITTEFEYNPWKELEAQLKGLISKPTSLTVSPVAGSVVVRGVPKEVSRVRKFLNHYNKEVLLPLKVNIQVLSVERTNAANFEVDISFAVSKILGSSFDITGADNGPASAFSLIKAATHSGNTLNATLNALRSLGTVSRSIDTAIPSLNGKPAQYYDLKREGYLANVSNSTEGGIVSSQLTPGEISSGFSFSYTGRVTGPNEVLLRMFVGIQDTPSFTSFTSNSTTIQLPTFESRGVNVNQLVKRGETILIAGFNDRTASSDEAGLGLTGTSIFGGKRNGAAGKSEQVILVTVDVDEPMGIKETRETFL
ncbi:MAG: hypothetical protein GY833_13030 [Aestuariibacter sp.]|nr:hypothetical protein [Aestuariibacter sp.]